MESSARKALPVTTGVIDYFPAALVEVAKVSKYGNDKHNPGQPLHHARGKSMDHADAIGRHLIDRGKIDPDTGVRHSAELAWRALALLQEELEADGEAPLARGAVLPEEPTFTDSDGTVRLSELPKAQCSLAVPHNEHGWDGGNAGVFHCQGRVNER